MSITMMMIRLVIRMRPIMLMMMLMLLVIIQQWNKFDKIISQELTILNNQTYHIPYFFFILIVLFFNKFYIII